MITCSFLYAQSFYIWSQFSKSYEKKVEKVMVINSTTAGWRFSSGTPVSSTNKTDHDDITEILLKVALNTTNSNSQFPQYQQKEQSLLILTELTEHKKITTCDIRNPDSGLDYQINSSSFIFLHF